MPSPAPPTDRPTGPAADPRLVLAIVTTDRRDLVSAVLPHLARQLHYPDAAVICVAEEADVDPAVVAGLPFPTAVIRGPKGASLQRNAILDHVAVHWPSAELAVFLDDDFVPAPAFLSEALRLALAHPDVVLGTGRVIADGIRGRGIPLDAALAALAEDEARRAAAPPARGLSDVFNVYGCNMVLRLRPILDRGVRFDVNLPLYSWLEDVEFSRALAGCGRIVRSEGLRGVHLGTKSGRTSGLRFGYSQVANPLYLARKGRMGARRVLVRIARNLLANAVRVWRPEPWVDRRGRLIGNALALRDLVAGRLSPTRILELD